MEEVPPEAKARKAFLLLILVVVKVVAFKVLVVIETDLPLPKSYQSHSSPFFLWVFTRILVSSLKDLEISHQKNFIQKSCSVCPDKNHPLCIFAHISKTERRERHISTLEMFSLHAQSVSTVSALRNCRANSRVNRYDSRVCRDCGANFSFFPRVCVVGNISVVWERALRVENLSSRALSFSSFVRPKRSSRGPLSER